MMAPCNCAQVKEVQLTARIKEVELAVKNQRNKFVNLIQAANQSTTEMKDKSKILQNEQEILHSEVRMG
jgi:hypothetical protein